MIAGVTLEQETVYANTHKNAQAIVHVSHNSVISLHELRLCLL